MPIWLRQAFARARAMLRRKQLDLNLARELEAHASLLEDEFRRRGLGAAEAKRAAQLELGGWAQLREAHYEARGIPMLETIWRDVRYALRTLRRDAGFAVFALLIGALGIGASTTIFSIVNALLIRQLPVKDPAGLVWVAKAHNGLAGDRSSETVPVNPFLEFRQQTQTFAGLAAYFAFYEPGGSKMTGVGEPERLTAVPVSDNFFPLLGVSPSLGRGFSAEECGANLPVVMLSEGFWKRRFAADAGIIGRPLTLNDRTVTIVGVVPFDFGSVLAPGTRVDLYSPLPLTPQVNRMGNTLSMIGRLRPGVTIGQARAEADVLTEPIGARNNRTGLRFTMAPLEERVRGRIRPALLVLSGAVAVVMLILCLNLSHLQLARAAARRKEMAIRFALGAGRGRLIQQMLTENLLLFGGAALLGLALAAAGTRLLAGLEAIRIPLREDVHVDGMAFGFTVIVAIATGVVCGLAPALQVPAQAVHDGLKEATRGASASRRQGWVRAGLVVAEIAFACVLLVGAGLLMRSFLRVLDVQLGFQPEQAAALRIDPRGATAPARNAYFDDVLGRVRALPGIGAAGLTDVLPLGGNRSWTVGAKEQTYSEAHPPPDAFVRIVSDGYLTAMGIPLRAGRDLDARDRDDSTPVIIINESLARAFWPGQNPIGKVVKYAGRTDRQVVGVVADVRHIALEQGSGHEFYLPIRQTGDYAGVNLVVRSSLEPSAALAAVRESLRPLEPNLAANEFHILRDLVDSSVSPRRFVTVLVLGFSVFALVLAALGIYGLISYSVSQRTQEIGIRMALGAPASEIQWRVLVETMTLTSLGLAIGVAASWLLARSMTALLFEVGSTDPVTFAGVVFALAAIAALAGYIPSRRASRTDPVLALRAN